MQQFSLKRNGRDDLVFTGEKLVVVDDREWMGIAPNWWELTLYRTEVGRFILASVFYLNYPRRKVMHGALVFEDPDDVREYLLHGCNSPSMIADALVARARRRIRDLDTPLPPLPMFNSNDFDPSDVFERVKELAAGDLHAA